MAPPFNGSTKVSTPPDPGTDKTLPPTGPNIPLNVINIPQQIIEFVDGDVYRTVTGNVDYEVRKDLKTHVLGNEKHEIEKDEKHFVYGKQYVWVIKDASLVISPQGSYGEFIQGAVTRTFLQPVTETYVGKHDVTQPEDFIDCKWYDNNLTGLLSTSIILGQSLELVTTHTEIGGLHSELKVSHPEVKVLSAVSTTIQAETAATKAKAEIFQAEMGIGARLKAILNALTSFGIGTPFR
jgi:hypothetical protein